MRGRAGPGGALRARSSSSSSSSSGGEPSPLRGARSGRLRIALETLQTAHPDDAVGAYRRCLARSLRGSFIDHGACAEEWEAVVRAMRALR